MKNLRSLKYFLVIEVIKYEKNSFFITTKYIGLIKINRYAWMSTYYTLIQKNHIIEKLSDQFHANKERFQRLICWLINLSHAESNIAYIIVWSIVYA